MESRINWDALGVTTSVLCAIHCAILPLAVASLPILGINIIHHAGFEYGMIALAFAIGTRALWHGFRRHHHRWVPLLLFGAGMSFLIAKQIWHDYELALLPFAVIGIVAAHVVNYRFSRVREI
ncbi:MerC domain-containing protein [Puia sp.]|uniref:MerC domain-containing protein n=1 Tax=Puia sp. TaxID=2045100 RepID=UPI002F4269FC